MLNSDWSIMALHNRGPRYYGILNVQVDVLLQALMFTR